MENHDLMYVTHNTEQKYKGTARPDMEGQMIRNYSMLYDKKMKMAHWVAYPLHRCYTENVDRKDNWVSDPLVGRMNFKLWFQNPMVGRFIEEDIKYRVMTV